jgi:3-methyladenine DNA glycosylase AlkD
MIKNLLKNNNLQVSDLERELKESADKRRAAILQRFFKTGPGEYGAGDVFLGLKVPLIRTLARKYADLSLSGVQRLLNSKFHGFRLAGFLILVYKYEAARKSAVRPSRTKNISQQTIVIKNRSARQVAAIANEIVQQAIVTFYLRNARRANNWDLVDLSVYKILGDFLLRQTRVEQRRILDKLVISDNIWERRMAIVATYAFIKNGQVNETFRIALKLLGDGEDLIHKAVGWMLREAGRRDRAALKKFLDAHIRRLPRVTLRYAIEHFPPEERQKYLKK